jgi:uncharacterized protein (TIGR01777 family)
VQNTPAQRRQGPPNDLVAADRSRRVVIAGGAGFLGRALARTLAHEGREVVVLSRRAAPADGLIRTVVWDGRTAGEWVGELEGAAAVVNLTGRSVACLYTPENRREIMASRVDSVRAIAQACEQCREPPPVLVQASSLAIYGDPGDRICDEKAPHGAGFGVEICEAWEGAFFAGTSPGGARRVALRIGFVLGRDGGALGQLAKLARWYIGGAAGTGRQYLSWLHLDDFCAMARWAIEHPEAQGAYNATGSAPVTNAEFMCTLRAALGRPWSPPTPVWAVKLGARFVMGVDPSLALTGRRCVPRRLLDEGFVLQHTDLAATLRGLLRQG